MCCIPAPDLGHRQATQSCHRARNREGPTAKCGAPVTQNNQLMTAGRAEVLSAGNISDQCTHGDQIRRCLINGLINGLPSAVTTNKCRCLKIKTLCKQRDFAFNLQPTPTHAGGDHKFSAAFGTPIKNIGGGGVSENPAARPVRRRALSLHGTVH